MRRRDKMIADSGADKQCAVHNVATWLFWRERSRRRNQNRTWAADRALRDHNIGTYCDVERGNRTGQWRRWVIPLSLYVLGIWMNIFCKVIVQRHFKTHYSKAFVKLGWTLPIAFSV